MDFEYTRELDIRDIPKAIDQLIQRGIAMNTGIEAPRNPAAHKEQQFTIQKPYGGWVNKKYVWLSDKFCDNYLDNITREIESIQEKKIREYKEDLEFSLNRITSDLESRNKYLKAQFKAIEIELIHEYHGKYEGSNLDHLLSPRVFKSLIDFSVFRSRLEEFMIQTSWKSLVEYSNSGKVDLESFCFISSFEYFYVREKIKERFFLLKHQTVNDLIKGRERKEKPTLSRQQRNHAGLSQSEIFLMLYYSGLHVGIETLGVDKKDVAKVLPKLIPTISENNAVTQISNIEQLRKQVKTLEKLANLFKDAPTVLRKIENDIRKIKLKNSQPKKGI